MYWKMIKSLQFSIRRTFIIFLVLLLFNKLLLNSQYPFRTTLIWCIPYACGTFLGNWAGRIFDFLKEIKYRFAMLILIILITFAICFWQYQSVEDKKLFYEISCNVLIAVTIGYSQSMKVGVLQSYQTPDE